MPLGNGSATAILTLDELDWATDGCDNIAAELGRRSLWAEATSGGPDIR